MNVGGGRGVSPSRYLPFWGLIPILFFPSRRKSFLRKFFPRGFSESLADSGSVRIYVRGISVEGYENVLLFFAPLLKEEEVIFESGDSLILRPPFTFFYPIFVYIRKNLSSALSVVGSFVRGVFGSFLGLAKGDILLVVESSLATPLVKSQILPLIYLFPDRKFTLVYPYPPEAVVPGVEALPLLKGSSRYEKGFWSLFFSSLIVFFAFGTFHKVLWARSFPPSFSLAVCKFLFRGKVTVFDVRGDWFYEQKAHFGVKGFWGKMPLTVRHFLKTLHKFLIKEGTVIYVSDQMREALERKHGVRGKNFFVAPPMVTYARFVGFERETVRGEIVVSGARIPWEEIPSELKDEIVFLSGIPYEVMPALLKREGLFGGVFRPSPMRKYVFPVKVSEYTAAGKPLVLSDGEKAIVSYFERALCSGDVSSERSVPFWVEVKSFSDFLKFKRLVFEYGYRKLSKRSREFCWEFLSWEKAGVVNYEAFIKWLLSGG